MFIRDIIATASKAQTEYRKLVDETLEYLRKLNVPEDTRNRVEQWFSFTWEQQHTLDETKILDSLPHKLKTDVAINVHFKTISKVELFEHCDQALLRDLVLKLKPVLFLPGDYICRKGEVGREMYIVKTGQVQVVGGEDGEEILATLTEGSVFGEVSLLNLAGTNRRTADVRSNGFSSLFVLKKTDLKETVQYYPNSEEMLKQKALELMKRNMTSEKRNSVFEILDNSDGDVKSVKSTSGLLVKKYYKKRKKKGSISLRKRKSITTYISRYKRQSKRRSSKIYQNSRLMYYIRKQRRKKLKDKNRIFESEIILE